MSAHVSLIVALVFFWKKDCFKPATGIFQALQKNLFFLKENIWTTSRNGWWYVGYNSIEWLIEEQVISLNEYFHCICAMYMSLKNELKLYNWRFQCFVILVDLRCLHICCRKWVRGLCTMSCISHIYFGFVFFQSCAKFMIKNMKALLCLLWDLIAGGFILLATKTRRMSLNVFLLYRLLLLS